VPEKYEKIKQEYLKKGDSRKVAEKKAAMTYNSQRKPGQKPVTRNSD
jgi:hypothetical protein